MIHSSSYTEKLPEPDLKSAAENASKESVTVLIEIEAPTMRVKIDRELVGISLFRPQFIQTPSASENAESEHARSEVRRLIVEMTGAEPHWLSGSNAFVTTLNGKQLRAIGSSPFVREIRTNRRLQSSR